MKRSIPPRTVGALLVVGQLLLLALIVVLPNGESWQTPRPVLVVGVALCVGGVVLALAAALRLGRALTPMPLPNEHSELRNTGVYRWVRHPIYVGLIAFAVGRTIISGNVFTLALCLALITLLWFKSRWEEQHLRQRYPEYEHYVQNTGRFLPRLVRRENH